MATRALPHRKTAVALAAALVALGAIGADADAGPKSGLHGSAQASAQVITTGSAVARCPAGKVVSGGFATPGFTKQGAPAVRIASQAVGRKQWGIDAVGMGGINDVPSQPSGPGGPSPTGGGSQPIDPHGNIISYAYCGKLGKVRARSISGEVQPASLGTVTARCGRKQRVIAGGFASPGFDVANSTGVITVTSHKLGKRGWTVEGINVSGDSQHAGVQGALTAIAYCVKHGPRLTTSSQQASIGAEQLRTIDVSCPPGAKAVSGGFDADIGPLDAGLTASGAVESFRMPRAGGWTTSAVSIDDSVGAAMTAYAYCLKPPA
jgi:hypothetical protein